jgi:hypothetical protein
MHSSGKLLVAYSSATGAAPIQEIYSHEITPTEIKPGVLAYSDRSIISGVTSIIEGLDGNLLIASSAPTHNTIEEFKFDVNTNTLERVGNNAFIAANVFIRSMSALLIAQ